MPDRVDAAVHLMEMATKEKTVDLPSRESQPEQLRPGDHAVLPFRQRG
jgi:hypothetical protein